MRPTPLKVGDKTYEAKLAWGVGEQYILTFDALDLVAVGLETDTTAILV